MDDHPFFADLELTERATAAGPYQVPVRLFDAAVMGLVYRIAPDRAEDLAGGQEALEPLITMGRGMVQLFLLEVRDSSLGPFSEVALALQVRRRGTSPSKVQALLDPHRAIGQGYWPVGVAVSTEAMRAACQTLWALPARLADVQTDFREAGVRAEVQGELEIMIGEAGSMKTPGLPITLVGTEGALLRTTVDVDHRLTWGGGASTTLRVTGPGPIAEAVIRLGLEGRRPSYVWRSMSSRAVLPAGEPLA